MSWLRTAYASLPLGCIALACTSSEPAGPTDVADDAGADAEVDVFTPSGDGAAPDTGTGDAGPPKRLELECGKEPCYVAVSGNGGQHTCGLLKDGTVRCWGADGGALGRGTVVSAVDGATPAPVVGLTDVTQISVGSDHGSCARTSDGSVYCWGKNNVGQLGRPRAESSLLVPTRVEGLPPVDFVALGLETACAITSSDRELYCWGARKSIIGDSLPAPGAGEDTMAFRPRGMTTFRPPVREVTMATSTGVSTLPTLGDTIIALLEGNVLATLGPKPAGESSLPPGSNNPNPVARELEHVVRAGAFAYLGEDGLVRRWVPSREVLHVPTPSEVVQMDVAGATNQGGVLLSSGRLFRWGLNTNGMLGVSPEALPFNEIPIEVPTNIVGGLVVSFATTTDATCALVTDGSIRCWGSNLHGELGRGTVDSAPHPEAEVIR